MSLENGGKKDAMLGSMTGIKNKIIKRGEAIWDKTEFSLHSHRQNCANDAKLGN